MSGPKREAGLLWPDVEGYRGWLTQRGYTPGTVRNMLKDLGQLGLWLSAEGLRREDLNEECIAAFLSARRDTGRRRIPGPRAMMPLLSYLREVGAAPERAAVVTPLGELVASYRLWMIEERGLALTTVLRYENTARRFLQESSSGGMFAPEALNGADINAFLLREFARVSAGSAKGRVAELRSVLRFLYLQGLTGLSLGASVPAVGGWRFATLPPPGTSAENVQLLLDATLGLTNIEQNNIFRILTVVSVVGIPPTLVASMYGMNFKNMPELDWTYGYCLLYTSDAADE